MTNEDSSALVVTSKKPPVTASGNRGVIMLHKSGEGADSQWFEYKPSFFQDTVRIEWDLDTMEIVLPVEAAEVVIRHGWARNMTEAEALRYNDKLKKTEAAEPPKPKPKKENEK